MNHYKNFVVLYHYLSAFLIMGSGHMGEVHIFINRSVLALMTSKHKVFFQPRMFGFQVNFVGTTLNACIGTISTFIRLVTSMSQFMSS